jgi:hypothetical protein
MWMAVCALLALAEAPPVQVAGGSPVVDDAEARLGRGQATEAVGLLVRHARHGDLNPGDRRRAALILARAADVLAAASELKGAAVAADGAFTLDPAAGDRATLARHVLAWATVLADDDDDPGARALAERAVAIDGDLVDAANLAARLAGTDSWTSGHLTLGAGVGLWITSVTGFVVAADRERLIRSAPADVDVAGLAFERDVASGVMWTAAAAAAVTSGIGLALIVAHDPGPAPVWPHPFPAIPTSTSPATTATRTSP